MEPLTWLFQFLVPSVVWSEKIVPLIVLTYRVEPSLLRSGEDCTGPPRSTAHTCLPVLESTAYTEPPDDPTNTVLPSGVRVGAPRTAPPVANCHLNVAG